MYACFEKHTLNSFVCYAVAWRMNAKCGGGEWSELIVLQNNDK